MLTIENQITTLVLGVFKANGAMLQWGDHFAAPFGLTSARWQMLGALALSDQLLSTPRIAESMGVTRQGAQKQINLLLEEELVERLSNPANMRSPLYCLSATGHELYQEIETRWKKHVRSLRQRLNVQELEIANKVLDGLVALHTQVAEGGDR